MLLKAMFKNWANTPSRTRSLETSSKEIDADSATSRLAASYRAPRMIAVASATTLLQGPVMNGPYRDCSNQWRNNWPDPNC
jgi:hypothetical protein